MIMNLEKTHMIMRENVNRKLDTYLDPLLDVPSSDTYHWRFDLTIDPFYVNAFMYVIKLH